MRKAKGGIEATNNWNGFHNISAFLETNSRVVKKCILLCNLRITTRPWEQKSFCHVEKHKQWKSMPTYSVWHTGGPPWNKPYSSWNCSQLTGFFLQTKSWRNHPLKLLRKTQIHSFFLTAWATQTAQKEEFMFQNVGYRPTVYRTGF